MPRRYNPTTGKFEEFERKRGQLNNVNRANQPAIANPLSLPPGGRTGAGNMPSGLNLFTPSFGDLEGFANYTMGFLQEANREGVANEVRRTVFQEQGFVRFAVYGPGERNPIVLDLKPGPVNRRGEKTLVENYPSGWIGDWEPQVFVTPEKATLQPTGWHTLRETVRQALVDPDLKARIGDSPQKRFNLLVYEGSKDLGIVGRHQQQGPPHPSTAIAQGVSKIAVGYSSDVEDITEANLGIMRRILMSSRQVAAKGPGWRPTNLQEQEMLDWSQLGGAVPTREEGDILTRLAYLYTTNMKDEQLMAIGLGRKDIDAIKRQSIFAGRERAFFYEQVNARNAQGQVISTLQRAEPLPVTGKAWGQAAGLRYATIPEWGEVNVDYGMVQPGTVMTPGEQPMSGALAMYLNPQNVGRTNKLVTAAYPTTRRVELPDFPMDVLSKIKVTLGMMEPEYDEAGKVINYRKTGELEGATLREEMTHTIGYYQMEPGGPKTPLNLQVGGSPVTINQVMGLLIPSHYKQGGEYKASSGYGGINEPSPIPATDIEELIRAGNQGLNVIRAGHEDQTRLLLDVGLWTGTGGKGYGSKESVETMPTLATNRYQRRQIRPKVTLTGPRGGTERRVATAITGEVKDWTQRFAAAFRYAAPEIGEAWIGELGQLEGEYPGIARTAAALQQTMRENRLAGRVTRPEELTSVYTSSLYGQDYAMQSGEIGAIGRLYWTEMMARLRYVTEEKLPATQAYQKYGWAKAGEQWLSMRATTTGERMDLMSSALGGVSMMMASMGGQPAFLDERGKVTKEGARAFKKLFPGGMREFVRWERSGNKAAPWIMSLRTPAETVLGTNVLYPEPEFMGGTPHIGFEEVAGLPGWAQTFTGMSPEEGPLGPERSGYGFRSSGTKAYQQMMDVVRYPMSKLNPKPQLAGRVIGRQEATELLAWIQNEGNNPELPMGLDFDELVRRTGTEPLILNQEVVAAERRGAPFLPPATVQNLSYSPFPWESEYYNPVDRITRTYRNAFIGWLNEAAGARQAPETYAFEREMRTVFEQATDTMKNIQSYQSDQTVGGRFGAATGIGLLTSLIPESVLNRVLRAAAGQVGIKGKEQSAWRKAALQQIIQMGGLPSLDTRYPFQSREAGWMPSMAMTPKMLAQRTGISFPEASKVLGGRVLAGSIWETGIAARLSTGSRAVSGDFDLDTLLKIFPFLANPNWQQEGQLPLLFPPEALSAAQVSEPARSKAIQETLSNLLGTAAGHPGGRFDVLAKQWVNIMEAVSPYVVGGKTRATAAGRGSTETTYERAWELAEAYIGGGKAGMGAEFNLQRMLTVQAGVLGIGDKIRTASGVHYQTPLDFMYDVYEQRGGHSRLQTLMQSAIFTPDNSGQVLTLKAMPQAKSKHVELWREGQTRDLVTEELALAAQADIEDIEGLVKQKPPRAFAGTLFAQRPEDIEWISQRFEQERAAKADRALPRTVQAYAEYLGTQGQQFNIWETTIGRTLFASAGIKATEYRPGKRGPRKVKAPTGQMVDTLQLLGRRPVEWGPPGETRTLGDILGSPDIQAGFITYKHLTRGGVLPPEDVALIQRLREQRVQQGKPVPPEWLHLTALYGGAKDVEAVERVKQGATQQMNAAEVLTATRATRNLRLKVSASQIPRLMATPDEQMFMGLEPEWAETAFERLLAENTLGWGGEGNIPQKVMDELFAIPEAQIRRGAAFQKQAQEYAVREYGLQDTVLDLERENAPTVNLERILSAREASFIKAPYTMGMRMTPDIIGLTPEGRIFLGEAKAGTSQRETGQVQAYAYAFALQRLAGWDPRTNQPWTSGGEYGFNVVMRKLLAGGNPMFRKGSREYRASTTEQRNAILKRYYQAASTGQVDIKMLTGEPGGTTIPFSLEREPGEGMGFENAQAFMMAGLMNAAGFYENEPMVLATQARLAQRVRVNPQLGIPETAAMRNAAALTPPGPVRTTVTTPGVTAPPTAVSGGGNQPPVVPPVTTAAAADLPLGGRSGGMGADQIRQLIEAIDKMRAETTTLKDSMVEVTKNGFRVVFGDTRSSLAGWRNKLQGFRNLYGALEAEQAAAPADQGPAELATNFQQNVAGGLVGDLSQQIAEASQNPQAMSAFMQRNWPMMKRLAALQKSATGLAANLRQAQTAQREVEGTMPAQRLLEPWEEVAIQKIAGFPVTTDNAAPLMHGHQVGPLAESAQLSAQLIELNRAMGGQYVNPRTGGTVAGPLPLPQGMAQEQALFLAQNVAMLGNEGTAFMALTPTQRKNYITTNKRMVAQWRREYLQAQVAQLMPGGEEPAEGSPAYAKLVGLRTKLKAAQDTELVSIERAEEGLEKEYAERMDQPGKRRFELAQMDLQSRMHRATVGRETGYAQKKHVSQEDKVLAKFNESVETINFLQEDYDQRLDRLLENLDQRGLRDLADRIRSQPRGSKARTQAAEQIQREIIGRVSAAAAGPGEAEVGAGLVEVTRQQEMGEVQRQQAEQVRGEYTQGGRFGNLARRLFGGFGLLYLRSIAGLMGTGAYTGYAERIQMEQQTAQSFLGVGGQLPVTPADQLARVEALQYGGQGGLLMTQARLNLMQNQQPLYNLMTTGLSGVSAGGMMAWLTGEGLGWDRRRSNMAGLLTGLGVAAGSQLLNIAGAATDVPGSAMSLAIRRARGENMALTSGVSILAGIGTGAAAGFAIGNVPGAIIGGVAGGLLGVGSNYQGIAGMINPEIGRQAEILNAISNRGTTPIQQVLANYNISSDMTAYYAQRASEIEASQRENMGISANAWAAASAYETKYGISMGDAQRERYARMAQGGLVPEAYGLAMAQLSGLSVRQAQGNYRQAISSFTQTTPTTPNRITPEQEYMASLIGPNGQPMYTPPATPASMITHGYRTTWEATGNVPATNWTQSVQNWVAGQPNVELAKAQLDAVLQAVGGLGPFGAQGVQQALRGVQPGREAEAVVNYGNQLTDMQATGWYEPYRQRLELRARRMAMGLTGGPEVSREDYANRPVSPERVYEDLQKIQEESVIPNMLAQWRMTSIGQFGRLPRVSAAATGLEIQQGMAQATFGGNMAQTAYLGGLGARAAEEFGAAFQNMPATTFRQFQGLFSMNPLQMAGAVIGNPALMQSMPRTLPGLGGSTIEAASLGLADINAGGLTGLAWGTTSPARPVDVANFLRQGMGMPQAVQAASQVMFNRVFAGGGGTSGAAQAWLQGGSFGVQAYQQMQSAQYQLGQAGIQMAQIALQEKYQPQFWALEDRSRQLGYQQTEWGFGQQAAQLEMQNRFFQQNMAMQMQQAQMQRGWTREDWGYQGMVRGMQWGWRQEDYQEQIKFMTGRQRKLAERQMERETIMYGLEGEQISKQKSRQEELWQLEDQRFAISQQQNQEMLKFQTDALNKQKEFFEERKKLEAEQVKLQREYWKENIELQKQAAGLSASYAKKQVEDAKDLLKIQQTMAIEGAKESLTNPETVAALAKDFAVLNPLFRSFIDDVERFIKDMGGTPSGGGATSNSQPTSPMPNTDPGDGYQWTWNGFSWVKTKTHNPTSSSPSIDPWSNTTETFSALGSSPAKQTVNIYLGNEKLGSFVIKTVKEDLEVG